MTTYKRVQICLFSGDKYDNPYFGLITNLFGIVVTDAQKEYSYSLRKLNRGKDMGIRVFVNPLSEDMRKKSQSEFSPDGVSRNFPSL